MPRKMTTVVHWIQSTDDLRGITPSSRRSYGWRVAPKFDFHSAVHAKAQSVNNNIRKTVRP